MVNYYVGRIKRGKLTIDDVPAKWRDDVQELLDADNV